MLEEVSNRPRPSQAAGALNKPPGRKIHSGESKTLDDAAAIRDCRRGESSAFRYLVERYQNQAMAHAMAILQNRSDAEDALQDALLDAYRALNRFDEQRSFYPWFYTILRNRCLKLAARRSGQTASSEAVEILAGAAADLENTQILGQALKRLPPESREILVLRHLDGLTYQELAERLGIPVGTVMSRLFYARKQLQTNLGGKR
jgi:RNA polymerase sigma-70 factor, ECF subfamily